MPIVNGISAELGPALKPSIIREFVDSGRDIILALNEEASSQIRELAVLLGVKLAPSEEVVIDHFNPSNVLDNGDHTVVLTSSLMTSLKSVFSTSTKGPVAYRGIGFSIPQESHTAMAALVGSSTAYSGSKKAPVSVKQPLAGHSVVLVGLIQARNNARAAVLGSTDMCSDDFVASHPENLKVCSDITKWTFHLKGVLKSSDIRHKIVSGSTPGAQNPTAYRINDQVEVALDLEECEEKGCTPLTHTNDMQIEFVMLDPYIRKTLQSVGNGTFSATVKIPDVYGVYKWIVDYRRPGWSWVHKVETVSVRPFRHHEYDRFITQAYPYYASAAMMMVGFWVLGLAFFK